MKKNFKLLFSILVLMGMFAGLQSFMPKKNPIVGKWQGTAKGKTGVMTFSKDGYLTLVIDGETMGGHNFKTESGDVIDMVYTVDFNKKPCWIDVTLKDDKGKKLQGSKGIFEFTGDDTMKVRISFEGSDKRPKDFSNNDETFTLKRVN